MATRGQCPKDRAVLVAISGIDGSGKGYLSKNMVSKLEQRCLRTALIHGDGWLNLPDLRFSQIHPADHFYQHAIRFDELFDQLVFPLRDQRSLCIDANYVEETATAYQTYRYQFEEIDIILLEGIYLLKRAFQSYYDLSFWIEYSFETALERAIARSQEGLSSEETIQAYQTIYFPAQRIHFKRDQPQTAATATIRNDKRLGGQV
ncbi:MAG: uridine kinase [Synechococcales cyanobacterium T60_A2020_003]|nr:uridine kinase [Synechococcales cyanobacterium T60_A2020_003]